MSVINYYTDVDSYSAQLQSLKESFKQQYFSKEKQNKILENANSLNSLTGFSVNDLENNIINQLNIENSNGDLTYDQALKKIYSALDQAESDPQAFDDTVAEIIAFRNGLLDGKKNIVLDDSMGSLNSLNSSLINSLGKISNKIGRVGEGVAEITMIYFAEQLINSFGNNNTNYTIKVEQTGDVKGTSQLTQRPVDIQTDNKLTILTDTGKVFCSVNFSTKAGSVFKTNPRKKLSSTKLRSGTIQSAINAFLPSKEGILNAVSLHKKNKDSNIYLEFVEAKEEARKVVGLTLLAQMLEEERIVNGQNINDIISFTIVGSRLVPEASIIQRMLNQVDNGKLRASISGIDKKQILEADQKQQWTSADMAEKYFLSRVTRLRMTI